MKYLLLDMDGVLVNFIAGICAAHRRLNPWQEGRQTWPWNFHHEWPLDDRTFWLPAQSHQFWENLEWMPDGPSLLAAVERVWEPDKIFLLSSPPERAPFALAGKVLWLERHLPRYSYRFLLGPAKEVCAHGGSVLVDDSDKNVERFEREGGQTVLVPRPWNRGSWNQDPVAAVERGLRRLLEEDSTLW